MGPSSMLSTHSVKVNILSNVTNAISFIDYGLYKILNIKSTRKLDLQFQRKCKQLLSFTIDVQLRIINLLVYIADILNIFKHTVPQLLRSDQILVEYK